MGVVQKYKGGGTDCACIISVRLPVGLDALVDYVEYFDATYVLDRSDT